MRRIGLIALPLVLCVGVFHAHAAPSGAARITSLGFLSSNVAGLISRPGHRVLVPLQTGPPSATVTATTVPSPIATPSVTTPSDGAALLKSASAALKAAHSYHFHWPLKVDVSELLIGNVVASGDANLSVPSMSAHTSGTASSLGIPSKINEYGIQIKKQAWMKSTKSKLRWKKAKITDVTDMGPSAKDPLNIIAGATDATITNFKVVGPETLGGVPVWHVQGVYTAKLDSTHTSTGVADYYIAQAGNLPVRVSLYDNDKANGLFVDEHIDYSRIGVKVTIRAPKVGSKTP